MGNACLVQFTAHMIISRKNVFVTKDSSKTFMRESAILTAAEISNSKEPNANALAVISK